VTFARAGTVAYAGRAGMAGAATIDPAALDALTKALDAIK
jgi:hypothetical protein